MRPEDVLLWRNASPFAPFRLVMNSGTTFEVRHPELVRLLRTSLLLFQPTDNPGIYDRAEMIGLVLIERIESIGPVANLKPAPRSGRGED